MRAWGQKKAGVWANVLAFVVAFVGSPCLGGLGLAGCGVSAQPGAMPGKTAAILEEDQEPTPGTELIGEDAGEKVERRVDVGGPCTSAAECVVVPAIGGWAEYPREGASCADACYAAILVSQREVWLTEKARIEPQIPCTKKRAKCGDMGALVASCQAGRCGVVAAP